MNEITVSTGEAARLLDWHSETVARKCREYQDGKPVREGSIRSVVINGRHRIPVAEVQRILAERMAPAETPPAGAAR